MTRFSLWRHGDCFWHPSVGIFSKNTMTQRLRSTPAIQAPARLLTLALLASLPALSAAETSPYYFGVNQAVTGDTNVFRRADGQPRARDLISSTGLLAGIDQPFGRSRLVLNLQANMNRFKNAKQLNNNDYDTRLQFDWATIERISGDVVAYDRRNLNRYDLSTAEGTLSTERDLLRVTGAALRARIGLVTRWTFETGYAYEEASHSLDSLSNRDVRQGSLNAGVRYAPSDLWSVRLGARKTEGEYPHFLVAGVQQADEFDRDDVDLSLAWAPSGNSKLDARISSTRESHSLQGQRDSNYVTGLLGYDWTITGKTKLRLQLARDTNAGRSDSDLALVTESSDTQVRDSLQLKATWDATAKISVKAGLNYSQRKLDNAFTLSANGQTITGASTARDKTTGISLGATYRPLRGLLVGCQMGHEQRSVDGQNVNTTYPFEVTTGTCNLQWAFR